MIDNFKSDSLLMFSLFIVLMLVPYQGRSNDIKFTPLSNMQNKLRDDIFSGAEQYILFDSLIKDIEEIIRSGKNKLIKENYDKAISDFLTALSLLDKSSLQLNNNIDQQRITGLYAKIKGSIAEVYSDIKSHEAAIDYYNKSFNDYHKINDTSGMETALNGIGITLKYLGLPEKSSIIYDSLFNLAKQVNDSLMMAVALNNKGLVFMDMGSYYSAMICFNQAIDIYKNCDDKKREAACYFNLGVAQGRIGNYDSIPYYYSESFNVLKKINDTSGMIRVQIELAQYYYSVKKYKTSLLYLDSAMFEAKAIDAKEFIINMYNYYSEVYSAMGNYKKALSYQNLYNQKRDSLFRLSKDKISNMRIEYETEKRDRLNELLVQENKIKELKIKKQKSQRNYLIALFALASIIAITLYSRYRLKKRTNKYLAKQKKQLETANLTKDKFFSIIAHDLKNPLSAAKSFTEILCRKYSNISEERRLSMLSNIDKSLKHTFHLLENLLTWSLAQKGRISFNPEVLSVEKSLNESLDLIRINAGNKNISIKIEMAKDIQVHFDKNMFDLVIRNLLSNAIKFSYENSKVIVRISTENDNAILSVIDHGIGIKTEDQGKLFRIDSTTSSVGTANEKGTGLGLILCKDFVERNGGKIWLESTPGKGSIFNFTLKTVEEK